MAEIDTTMLTEQHGDIRREAAEHTAAIQLENMKGFDRVNADVLLTGSALRHDGSQNTSEIIKEGLKESFNIRGDVKDTRYDVSTRISDTTNQLSNQLDSVEDVMNSQLFTLARESADNRAQILALGFQVRDGNVTLAKDVELNALKTQIETAKQTTYLSDKIDGQAETTRALINDLKYGDLNRALIERNSELVDERHERRHWRHNADVANVQGQWAAVNSQLQAFASQLQDVKQGTVNFGTMSGNAGRNQATNNVA
jgi:hypothetical protein